MQHYVIKTIQWVAAGRYFFAGTPVSSTNKADFESFTVATNTWLPLRNIGATNYKPVLYSSITYHRVCKKSNIKGATCEVVIAYSSGAHKCTPVAFSGVRAT
jgi:hypothetical protein